MLRTWRLAMGLALAASLALALPAAAHRPYFEEQDVGPAAPWRIDDPTISTVVYATLEGRQDVDYFAFDGRAGQRILLEMVIPQIEGQADFAPTMALMGPGLPAATLPSAVVQPRGSGALLLPPPPGPAPTFFEPFSRTSYWERQSQRVTLPAGGRYVVAVWHPEGRVGRYGFVIGDKERPGGDLAFGRKLRSYWTPVPTPPAEATPASSSPAPEPSRPETP
ncbi:MAG: hypothetical protein RMN53_17260, partial [Anaerolineae bacterium]|nr:hypothetical protein [Anaerolineae bacterium]